MTAAFLSSVLFAGCTKSDNVALAPTSGDNATITSPIAKTSEDLMVVDFRSGHLITDYIKVQIEDVEEEFKGVQKVNLFMPIAGADIPAGHYTNFSILMHALPNSDGVSMTLRGNVTFEDGVNIPIVLNIGEQMILFTEPGPVDVNDASTYLDLLRVKQAALLQGIGEDDLRNAEIVNNEILLSSAVNSELYKAVFDNLRAMTGVKTLTEGVDGVLLAIDIAE